jgi:hypothetical protein
MTESEIPLQCRRLFLRGWNCTPGQLGRRLKRVDVELYVRYKDSDSDGDDFAKVVDYNVMRDALHTASHRDADTFLGNALTQLMCSPVVWASVEVFDDIAGTSVREIRTAQG